MVIVFHSQAVPRNTSREDWKVLWRWKRKKEKELSVHVQQRIDNLAVYGTTHPELFEDVINPSVCVHP